MRDHERGAPEPGNPSDSEQQAAQGVERLLAELADLRILLDSDLTLTAAALDADAPGLASEMLDDEHERLNSLQARILRGVPPVTARPVAVPVLAPALAPVLPMSRVRRLVGRLPAGAAAAVAAAAVAVAVLGASVIPSLHSSPPTLAADVAHATHSYDAFNRAANSQSGDAADVQAAAAALHASLGPLIAAAGNNPESAQRALELLQAEQLVLLQSKPAGAQAILREARRLVERLRSAAPSLVPPAAVRPLATQSPAKSASPKPATKPSPSTSPTTSPSPSPTSSPSPSPSPKPSSTKSPAPQPSPSNNSVIPGV